MLTTRRVRARGFAWPLLALGMAALNVTLVGTLSPAMVAAIGGGDLYVSIVPGYIAAAALGALLVALRPGPLAGTWALAGGVAVVAGCAISGVAPAMPLLVAGRLLAGAGAGAVGAGVIAMCASAAAPSALGAVTVGIAAAAIVLGPAVGALLTEALGWRAPFLLTAGTVGIAAVGVRWTWLGDWPATVRPDLQASGALSRDRARRLALGVAALLAIGDGCNGLLFVPLAGPIAGGRMVSSIADPLAMVVGIAAGLSLRWIPWRTIARGGGAGWNWTPGWQAAAISGVLTVGFVGMALSTLGLGPVPPAIGVLLVGLGIGAAAARLAAGAVNAGRAVAMAALAALVGVGAVGAVFLVDLRTQLLANLRVLIDLALLTIPAASREQTRQLAEKALAEVAQGIIDPANIAGIGKGFGGALLARVPQEYRALIEPYQGAIDVAYLNAAHHAIGATWLGAGVAAFAAALLFTVVAIADTRRGSG